MTDQISSTGSGFDFQKAMLSFDGRLRRSHFWIAWAILFAIGFVVGMLPVINLLGIVLLWPHLAIGVKRFQDMGKPGWLIAIPYVASVVAWIAAFIMVGASAIMNAAALDAEDPAAFIATFGPALGILAANCLLSLVFWLWMGLADSQRGDNRYGPNPKGL